MNKALRSITLAAILTGLAQLLAQEASPAQELLLQLDPAKSGATIILTGNMHTVDGSFLLKHGAIRFNPTTGKASGEVVFDATSGKTGNGSRDNKMHKDVIQSRRYPEIVFHPDHADGTLSTSGDSTFRFMAFLPSTALNTKLPSQCKSTSPAPRGAQKLRSKFPM